MATNYHIDQFDTDDTEDISQRWTRWSTKLNRLLAIKNVELSAMKINYLFFYGGDSLEDVYNEIKEANDTYDNIITKLTTAFNSATNLQLNIFNFRSVSQEKGEPFEEFLNKLREKAKICNVTGL